MKIALFNDTSSAPHVGCLAVGDAHNRLLEAAGAQIAYRFFLGHFTAALGHLDRTSAAAWLKRSFLLNALQDVDAVVVNGEGTIHHGAGHDLLAILDFAQWLGKKTLLVNCVLQDVRGYFDTLRRLDDLTCREPHSLAYLDENNVAARLVPDSILAAEFDSSAQRPGDPAFAGKIIITDHHPLRNDDVGQTLKALLARDDATYFPLENGDRFEDWRQTLPRWQEARLVVTGRHHGVYLSLLAGVPCIALGSNTWKVQGTLQMLQAQTGIDVPFHTDGPISKDLIARTAERTEDFHRLRDHLRGLRALNTFDALTKQDNRPAGPAQIHAERLDTNAHPPAARDTSDSALAKGLVLILNEQANPDQAVFWGLVGKELSQQGYLPVMLSTMPISIEHINVIEIPATLPGFAHRYPYACRPSTSSADADYIDRVRRAAGCSKLAAQRAIGATEHFLTDLVDALRPASVAGSVFGHSGPATLLEHLLRRVTQASEPQTETPAWFTNASTERAPVEVAHALATHPRPVDAGLHERIDRFLQMWKI